MPAYLICDIEVTDPDAYEAYKAMTPAAIAAHGGRFLVRGGNPQPVEGGWEPTRIVVLEFPDMAAARAFYDGPAYRKARETRAGAAVFRAVFVEGA